MDVSRVYNRGSDLFERRERAGLWEARFLGDAPSLELPGTFSIFMPKKSHRPGLLSAPLRSVPPRFENEQP